MKKSKNITVMASLSILLLSSCGQAPVIVHNFEEPTYVWADDYSTCTASRICIDDAFYSESETNESTFTYLVEPTSTAAGSGRYEVSFRNPVFETQTIDIDMPTIEREINEQIYNKECSKDYLTKHICDINYTFTLATKDNLNIYHDSWTLKYDNGKIYYYYYIYVNELREYEHYYYFNENSYQESTNSWEWVYYEKNKETGAFEQQIITEDPYDCLYSPYFADWIPFSSYVYQNGQYKCQSISVFNEYENLTYNLYNFFMKFENRKFVTGEYYVYTTDADGHESNDQNHKLNITDRGVTTVILPQEPII